MRLPLWQVDAFTDRPFAGNPAAVCLLSEPRDDAWLQDVARELRHSETAFLRPREDGFDLRWFTPTTEVDLCGHATLASAHVLWEERLLAPDQPARFFTRSGLLTARRAGDWIELDFPAEPPEPCDPPPDLLHALGIAPRFVGQHRQRYLVELDSEQAVRALQPDLNRLRTLPNRGVIVTGRATSAPFDFVCRFFAPTMGIDEDPVTGSAQCLLGPYWAARLGKDALLAYQASTRGGVLRVRVTGERVAIGGQAVTVLRGELVA